MQRIVQWMLQMEKLAGNIYRETADRFSENIEFNNFLLSLAEDEDIHFQHLQKVYEKLQENMTHTQSAVIIDQITKDQVKAPLEDLHEQINAAHEVSENAVMKIIINVEFSELNDIFKYVFNFFYGDDDYIKDILLTIHTHLDKIKNFLSMRPYEKDLSGLIKELTAISERKFLVVEDDKAVRDLLAVLLKQHGSIETAVNGQEALEKVRDSFFDVIVSDIGMPLLNGMEFYEKAIKIKPNISGRFVFCTGDITPEVKKFFDKNYLPYLEKPFKMNQLLKTVQALIDR